MALFGWLGANKSKEKGAAKSAGFNAPLIEAIADLYEGKKDGLQKAYDLLATSQLLVPMTEPVAGGQSTSGIFTTKTESGGLAVLCFTHVQALHAWKPGWGPAAAMSFLDISRQVEASKGQLDAIVVNQAGPIWLKVRRVSAEGSSRWELHWPRSPQDKDQDFKGHVSTYPS